MIDFEERHSLDLGAVVSFRGLLTQQESAVKIQEISQTIAEAGAHVAGPFVTAVHEQVADGRAGIEIIVPVDRPVDSNGSLEYCDSFRLENCLVARNEGNPDGLTAKIESMRTYVEESGLRPISVGYTVVVRDIQRPEDIDDMVVEFYLPVDG